MAEPRARTLEGMKFMWDGKVYENSEEADKAREEYEREGFITQMVEEDDEVHVYTRRVVTEAVTEGTPPA